MAASQTALSKCITKDMGVRGWRWVLLDRGQHSDVFT